MTRRFWDDLRPTTIAMGVVIVICVGAAFGVLAASLQRTGLGGQDASASPTVASSTPSAAASSVLGASDPASGSPTASAASPGPRAIVDRTLLRVLPATVGSLTVTEFPEAETQAVTDPDLGRNVIRVATAFVGDAGGANWAYAAVVDVRPEAQSATFYRDWQESFDRSACENAGGVTGHTTVTIAGRSVERTACGSGVRTYHLRLTGTNLLISVSDLGAAALGAAVLANLRP